MLNPTVYHHKKVYKLSWEQQSEPQALNTAQMIEYVAECPCKLTTVT